MPRRAVLALMAHPDDAEILCVGTLIRLAQAGWEVHIATMTPGDCGSMTESQETLSARRTGEAAASAKLIGATYHCLDERDGLVVYDKTSIHKCVDLFRAVAPQLAFTHTALDYMMDHVMTSLLVRAASFVHGAPNSSKLPLREGTCIPHLYYCDSIDGNDIVGKPIKPTTCVDISGTLEKKAEMLACHASQREWLRSYHGNDEYIDSMRRHAAWRGRESNVAAAEAFVQHRGHAYPNDDILKTMF
jgi:LmbE family N-acetylglucosaminyl deacetylase